MGSDGTPDDRYPLKAGRHSSHSRIVSLCGAGQGRHLLDVGCARGHLASALQTNGWVVTGVEPSASDAALARRSGVDVVEGGAEEALRDMTGVFDVVVFADVLEHMTNPEEVLRLGVALLSPGGRVVISVPNIAHVTVRASLLLGRFNYADRGIMDRTHMRFFTRRSLLALLESAGLGLVRMQVTPAPIEEVLPVFARHRALRPLLGLNAALAGAWKSGLAYQYVVVATPR